MTRNLIDSLLGIPSPIAFLTVDELTKLSTQRLLTILKLARKNKCSYGWHVIDDGNDSYDDIFSEYCEYCDLIKNILKDRPHLETKSRKRRGTPLKKVVKKKHETRAKRRNR